MEFIDLDKVGKFTADKTHRELLYDSPNMRVLVFNFEPGQELPGVLLDHLFFGPVGQGVRAVHIAFQHQPMTPLLFHLADIQARQRINRVQRVHAGVHDHVQNRADRTS